MTAVERRRLVVTGVVQGVGFRPFVHRLATELGLGGSVRNQAGTVHIDVEGPATVVDRFRARVRSEAPAAARIVDVETSAATIIGPASAPADRSFSIEASEPGRRRGGVLPPDTAPCARCMAEFADPADRRHRHPFISCTQCGPRFTIAVSMPYDRESTTMAGFSMCERCQAEYDDPADRRHHAQPISCWSCGPRLVLTGPRPGSQPCADGDAVDAAIVRLSAGGIVAVKGVGGYHLAVDAADSAAVGELRDRKRRPHKPFAVMVPDLRAAHEVAALTAREASTLEGPDRPIVLARRRGDARVCDAVAPGSPLIGVMLPSSPLHHLLFSPHAPRALVMTSGNVAGEPICHRDTDAFARLGPLVDAILHHDREIRHPCDDSVVRIVGDHVVSLRRSRGVVPLPVRLPFAVPPLVAAGGDLKNVFAYAEGHDVWLSQHIGDLHTIEAHEALESTAELVATLSGVRPRVAVTDAHPQYFSRRWGRRQAPASVDVHHHHAHAAALMADNGLPADAELLTFVFDGTGYGPDGSIWGGEVLLARYDEHERLAHLLALPLPGGDAAVQNPCRIALGHLRTAGLEWRSHLAPIRATTDFEREAVARQLMAAPTASSMGRLFDSVASILDVCHRVSYEAQAAIELEHAAAGGVASVPLRFEIGSPVVDPRPVLRGVVDAIEQGVPVADIAASFHRAVVEMVVSVAEEVMPADRHVGLTGGVFQNALLLSSADEALRSAGFIPVMHTQVPPSDAGLALGQAAVLGAQPLRQSPSREGEL